MTNNLTRRDWLVGTSAVAGSMMIANAASAQDMASMTNMGMPISKDNPIRMTNNENPYGINPKAMDVIIKAYKRAHIYNFRARRELTKVIADMENIPEECIAVGAGSSEYLVAAGTLCAVSGGDMVIPEITFGSITRSASALGSKIIQAPMNEDLSISLDSLRKAMTKNTKCVYICNPNNPVPSIVEKTALEQFCLEVSKQAMVVVDEAYYEYVRDDSYSTMAHLIKDNPNIIVLRTASKIHAFANVRIGFAFAHPDTMKKLMAFRSGTSSYPAIMGAVASYKDLDYQKFVIDKNYESLEILYKMFEELNMPYVKAHANFVFANAGRDASEVREKLLESGVLIGRQYAHSPNWIRISTAKPEETQYMVDVYKRDFG
ncbi:pyridoxal phosphate-dependent aminotransferase [Pseudemcibacter aquimaris]|uniref:pyridoxal phosphate-dependent aminotransferase n=1 Tax=Pseudemcibacter aquimaris TaxID=2857064 RepID=UPI0020135158|nr:aminotransferase class I/II-fold pyridoxal phosphate-dependent enzyme [Pseudemcibacter aquimaris]MCC3860265.1 aminotransferase class I/II-fold pyridoxal phosphate-dependent enzyme [Pseudemcibacter aquimaris]WDU57590.1 aminotransferase class I/II-fold pyridoxal phosphate-dependent enzyme [Pseudemcibacter aquimaris]